jgi:hypothetical protein
MSNLEIARFETDEKRRQAKATKELSKQLHSRQTLSKKIFVNEFEQFAKNAQRMKIKMISSI